MKKTAILLSILMMLIAASIIMGCGAKEPVADDGKSPAEIPADPLSCSSDADCVCGGVDKNTQRCFLGNKAYYDRYVDKEKACPDFCGGLDGSMIVRCVDKQCVQMYECLTDMECEQGERCKGNRCIGKTANGDGCSSDSDCVTGGCSGTVCQSRGAEPIYTTCEMRPEYECYRTINCGCVGGGCEWKRTAEFDSCVEEKMTGPV
ncbi:TPA: eight-cysteine-cluster domain-containing protein [Candidatus Woesearchaeota archaeon]|nr:eight-cysteine-cluster domain-containing protein [Candidatus Woesearchaeota archaeon]